MNGGLTKRQAELLAFLRAYIGKSGGVAPSYDEIMAAINLTSKSNVHHLLKALEERGFIKRTPNRARCIFLIDEQPSEFARGYANGYREGRRMNAPCSNPIPIRATILPAARLPAVEQATHSRSCRGSSLNMGKRR